MAYTLLSKGHLAKQTEVLQIYAHMLPIRVGGIYKTGLFYTPFIMALTEALTTATAIYPLYLAKNMTT